MGFRLDHLIDLARCNKTTINKSQAKPRSHQPRILIIDISWFQATKSSSAMLEEEFLAGSSNIRVVAVAEI
jgi:hypothetical protein